MTYSTWCKFLHDVYFGEKYNNSQKSAHPLFEEPVEEPLKPQCKGPWIVCAWGVPELVSLQPCWTLSCTWATKGGLVLSKVYFNSQLTLSRYGDCVLAALSSLSWTQHIYLLQHCFSDWYVAALSAMIKISLPDICHYCGYTTIQAIWLCTEIAEDVVFVIATQTWQVHMIGQAVAV